MPWGAPNTGYYAALGPGLGQVNCQPRLMLRQGGVVAQRDDRPVNFVLRDRQLRCGTLALGAPRGNHMADFQASFARNSGGGVVVVGFIQNLLSSTRVAEYGALPLRLQMWRNGALVGNGLLDCGTNGQPWFQGHHANLTGPAPGQPQGMPAMVEGGDNPRWEIPLHLSGPESQGQALPLTRVTLQNRFRLFGVAQVNGHTHVPICRTEWLTDIQWDPANGLRAQVTQVGTWAAATPMDAMITAGATANATLVDQIRRV